MSSFSRGDRVRIIVEGEISTIRALVTLGPLVYRVTLDKQRPSVLEGFWFWADEIQKVDWQSPPDQGWRDVCVDFIHNSKDKEALFLLVEKSTMLDPLGLVLAWQCPNCGPRAITEETCTYCSKFTRDEVLSKAPP